VAAIGDAYARYEYDLSPVMDPVEVFVA